MDKYVCAAREDEIEIVIEKSRFIGYVSVADTEDEARAFLGKIKKKHPFATHNCYAYVTEMGTISRYSDDGEPKGSALPMLEVLKTRKLCNTIVVVTRYFGGIKLGAGGLIRAYSGTATAALDKAGTEEHILSAILKIDVAYDAYQALQKFLENRTCIIKNIEYGNNVSMSVATPKESVKLFEDELRDYMQGRLEMERKEDSFEVYAKSTTHLLNPKGF